MANLWDSPGTRNVMLFSYLYPAYDSVASRKEKKKSFIKTHCSTPGGIKIGQVLTQIYEDDEDMPWVRFENGEPQYIISSTYLKDPAQENLNIEVDPNNPHPHCEFQLLVQSTFDKSREEAIDGIEGFLNDDSLQPNPKMVQVMREFFTENVPLKSKLQKKGGFDDIYVEYYIVETNSCRFIIYFGGYSYSQSHDKFIARVLDANILREQYNKPNDIRMYVTPFASDDLLSGFRQLSMDSSILVLDAVSMLSVERTTQLGGDSNGGKFTDEQIKRMPKLKEGVVSGLINWERRLGRVIKG